jgi:hypothetical protein
MRDRVRSRHLVGQGEAAAVSSRRLVDSYSLRSILFDGVGMIRSLAPPIRDYHIGTAGGLKILTRLFISYRWVIAAKRT